MVALRGLYIGNILGICRVSPVVIRFSSIKEVRNMGLQRWFALQLELIGGIMLLCVAVMIVLQSDVHLGMSGLSLTYAQSPAVRLYNVGDLFLHGSLTPGFHHFGAM